MRPWHLLLDRGREGGLQCEARGQGRPPLESWNLNLSMLGSLMHTGPVWPGRGREPGGAPPRAVCAHLGAALKSQARWVGNTLRACPPGGSVHSRQRSGLSPSGLIPETVPSSQSQAGSGLWMFALPPPPWQGCHQRPWMGPSLPKMLRWQPGPRLLSAGDSQQGHRGLSFPT